MRRIILTGALIFTLILAFFCLKTGLGVPFKVHSYGELRDERKSINDKLDTLTAMKSGAYAHARDQLDATVASFRTTKVMYDSAVNNKTELEKRRAIGGASYDLSYLWVKIGNHANNTHCDLTIEVYQNAETPPEENYVLCDLKFSVSSSYANTINFIEKMSTDTELNFIPENMRMYSEYTLVKTDEDYTGRPLIAKEKADDPTYWQEATILLVKTEFYKTNVPIAKASLSKIESQTPPSSSEEEDGITINKTTNNTTNNENTTDNTTNSSN